MNVIPITTKAKYSTRDPIKCSEFRIMGHPKIWCTTKTLFTPVINSSPHSIKCKWGSLAPM